MQLYRKRHIFKNFPVAGLLNFSWRKQGLLHSNEEICTRPGFHRTSKGSSFLADIAWMKTNIGLQLLKQKMKKTGKSLYGGRRIIVSWTKKWMYVIFVEAPFAGKISFYLGREQLLAAQLQCWLCDNFESECRKNFPLIFPGWAEKNFSSLVEPEKTSRCRQFSKFSTWNFSKGWYQPTR